MKKIGITGHSGFLGKNLSIELEKRDSKYTIIPFNKNYFNNDEEMDHFLGQCDVVIHLAAVCRSPNPEDVYSVNMLLCTKILESLDRVGNKPHLLISSSIQEEDATPYGKSKKEGRQLMKEWSVRNGAIFTGLIFPNIFGPHCKPYYASFIATFCDQLLNNNEPVIQVDRMMNLLFVSDAVDVVLSVIDDSINSEYLRVEPTDNYKVSEVLTLLKYFKENYIKSGTQPILKNKFEKNLFNVFKTYKL